MTVTISGDNGYRQKQEIKKIKQDFLKQNPDGEVLVFDGEDDSEQVILSAIQNTSLFSGHKLIVVKNFDKNKDLSSKAEAILGFSTSVVLVIVINKVDKRSQLYRVLKKETDYRELGSASPHDMPSWVSSQVKERGGSISFSDARLLIERVGIDQQLVSNELDKLISFQPDINKSSIELLSEPTAQSTVFQLIDMAFSGKVSEALRLYDEQRAQRVEPIAIMGMIGWQLHILAIVKSASGMGVDDIAKQSKMSPFVISKAKNINKSISRSKLDELIGVCLKLDVQMKSVVIDADEAIKHLIIQMAN